ncbi:MAG: primosomal protein N' [Cyclobacteriaceae bacterium]|nr:primosomal protein N' [Cyclobacteriaceae bacterium]UYN85698.1 MAG: primosomal protein N' [Cyclobacteriaceae bacterium]
MDELFPDSRTTLFAEVLLPVPIAKRFTYRVPFDWNDKVLVGQRTIVQFGDRRILTGIIASLYETPPTEYEAKYLLDLLDEEPIIHAHQLRFYEWMADYYMCTTGEVLNAALPSGLKLSSESMVQLHPAFDWETTLFEFSEKETMLLKHLASKPMSYTEVASLLGIKSIYSILKSLTGKESIILFEEVKEKFKPKKEKYLRLTTRLLDHKALEQVFSELVSKPKQEAILLKYLQDIPVLHDPVTNRKGIRKNQLMLPEFSASALNTLIKNNILEEFEVIVSRFNLGTEEELPDVNLSDEQLVAQQSIFQQFEKHNTVLFHGITGSGKTEVYINLIKRALESGSQVLYLLPEIALTTQIVQRLRKMFGESMGVYHSRFSDNERVEVWNGVLNGRFKFVVGVRSSIFLPFDNLGLIIVDEEHDTSYKQQEPAPRYHARDAALMMAHNHHSKIILGSATPSMESYHLAHTGKYGLVELHKRYGDARLPEVILANMMAERKQKTTRGDFSGTVLRAIGASLAEKEQVIIFQNRRGYSPILDCEDCGWVPKCINCAVSLTYHQFKHSLICHYCGYKEPLPSSCPSCSSKRLRTMGYGTEKLEEELKLYFPEAHIQRMDLDTTRSKTSYETIIEQFEKGDTDILVGTQMVTKGLDFDKVSLVGVFNADRMMHFPDFRSYERAFQLITQVSGRAGRREKPGKVVIQTSSPDHPVLNYVLNQRMREFYAQELTDRQNHLYPPFSRLIEITVKHIDKKITVEAARVLWEQITQNIKGIKVLGPGEPMISRIRNQYLMNLLVKIPRDSGNLAQIKQLLASVIGNALHDKPFRNTRVIIDVDPV